MPYHLVLAELLDLGWHWEWEQCLRLLWLRRCVRGRHCSSDGTMWALDTLSALRNMCLGVRRQAPLLWEKVCEEWDWLRFPWQDESPPPWTRQPGLPEVSHPLNLHEYLPMVSPASMSPVSLEAQPEGGPSGSTPCSGSVRSLYPRCWSLPTCVWELLVPSSSWSPSPLYPNVPCVPALAR